MRPSPPFAAAGQHLSDEAVAACADGVLRGHARERAERHVAGCGECAHAVRVQREAVWALRAAPPPSLPLGLADRLRVLPQTTPLSPPPGVFGPDGSPLLPTTRQPPRGGAGAGSSAASMFALPAAALVPARPEPRAGRRRRVSPLLSSLAVVAVTGGLAVGVAADRTDDPAPAAPAQQVVRDLSPTGAVGERMTGPINLLRAGER